MRLRRAGRAVRGPLNADVSRHPYELRFRQGSFMSNLDLILIGVAAGSYIIATILNFVKLRWAQATTWFLCGLATTLFVIVYLRVGNPSQGVEIIGILVMIAAAIGGFFLGLRELKRRDDH